MMRRRFDRIEIVDLRGDVRLGERAGVDGDQGVFDIQVGTAITIAIADGSRAPGASAEVHYLDSWAEGRFPRESKFQWLLGGSNTGSLPNAISINRGSLADMRAQPFQNGEWVSLRDAFGFSKSGMKSGRDEVFVSPSRTRLRNQVLPHLNGQYDHTLEMFYCYRPLDRRWFYNDLRLLNRPGPEMQRVWGLENVCLYGMPFGTGAGPAVWCHALLPDYHAFRGNYGGYAFPLFDRRPRVNSPNLFPALVASLGAAYGVPIGPEDVFDAILCLLSASSYTRRFAEDLEDTFPHIPFPARREAFLAAVGIGREIRAVETFARPPGVPYHQARFARVETPPRGPVGTVNYTDGVVALCADGSGRITGIPEAVWSFAVSGYRVLPRWIESRKNLPADIALVAELRDICSRIAELIDLFAEADTVLAAALGETLTRAALGLGAGDRNEDGGAN